MGEARVPIEVDDATGVWSVDGVAMILVPRHFIVNNHTAIEAALGEDRYAQQLFEAGHKSAYVWCEQQARLHGLEGVAVFHHYMKRLSQRGWGQFLVEAIDADSGHARVRVDHSVFVLGHQGAPRKTCYMFRGWFPGSLELAGKLLGKRLQLTSTETQCAAEAHHDHCVFEIMPG